MTTIKEDYISFEIAKLLKEKGFNEQTRFCFRGDGNILHNDESYVGYPGYYPRPTLQMAMKWLRREHKLHIQIWILEEKGYWYDIEQILNAQYKHKSLYSTGLEDIYFETCEQAAEAAIKYCLENLI